ncbi:AAA family ATPase [Levilactobacillus brevis]|uniref:AAA family ATPase n=1 Tax=Levilactobacillus brevis TaxID=1580 RepID=UPI000847D5D1|nr:AAA family ATPase [Levilactobacillus brevis]ODP94802.1 hypothetical protein BGC39_10675 [Levilactobacillus brevis]
MYISKLRVHDFRAFQDPFEIQLSKNITAISGLNGIGKSTLLAILTNTSELKKKDGSQLNGSAFKGDFSDLILYDSKTDSTGEKVDVFFDNLPVKNPNHEYVNMLTYRAIKQEYEKSDIKYVSSKQTLASINSNGNFTFIPKKHVFTQQKTKSKINRYRLIPQPNERKGERKINWPVSYLGLSRLYPMGESDIARSTPISQSINKEILKIHKEIMSERFDETISAMESVAIAEIPKGKLGISTENYESTSNSGGQDNLGQIILSVLSFKELKRRLEGKTDQSYNGGLLAIDEIDATLHPAAQFKLLDYLYRQSVDLDLQIVFTTHSHTLLEYMNTKRSELGNDKDKLKNCYLKQSFDHPGTIQCTDNPSDIIMKNNLEETYMGDQNLAHPISVFTEDSTARWFLNFILSHIKHDSFNIQLLDIHVPFDSLATIAASDFETYQNSVFILDPDVLQEENLKKISNIIQYSPIKLNEKGSNIKTLPGPAKPIEQLLSDFLLSLDSENNFYKKSVKIGGYDKKMATLHSPTNDKSFNQYNGTKKYKKWFKDFSPYRDILLAEWVKSNKGIVQNFVNHLSKTLKNIENRAHLNF